MDSGGRRSTKLGVRGAGGEADGGRRPVDGDGVLLPRKDGGRHKKNGDGGAAAHP